MTQGLFAGWVGLVWLCFVCDAVVLVCLRFTGCVVMIVGCLLRVIWLRRLMVVLAVVGLLFWLFTFSCLFGVLCFLGLRFGLRVVSLTSRWWAWYCLVYFGVTFVWLFAGLIWCCSWWSLCWIWCCWVSCCSCFVGEVLFGVVCAKLGALWFRFACLIFVCCFRCGNNYGCFGVCGFDFLHLFCWFDFLVWLWVLLSHVALRLFCVDLVLWVCCDLCLRVDYVLFVFVLLAALGYFEVLYLVVLVLPVVVLWSVRLAACYLDWRALIWVCDVDCWDVCYRLFCFALCCAVSGRSIR